MSEEQTSLPFMRVKPVCVFCSVVKGAPTDVLVKFIHLEDSKGNHYALVNIPTCPEHQQVPTIHERGPGVKP